MSCTRRPALRPSSQGDRAWFRCRVRRAPDGVATESSPTKPVSSYGAPKLAGTSLGPDALAVEQGVALASCGPFNVVSPDLGVDSALGNLRRQLLQQAGESTRRPLRSARHRPRLRPGRLRRRRPRRGRDHAGQPAPAERAARASASCSPTSWTRWLRCSMPPSCRAGARARRRFRPRAHRRRSTPPCRSSGCRAGRPPSRSPRSCSDRPSAAETPRRDLVRGDPGALADGSSPAPERCSAAAPSPRRRSRRCTRRRCRGRSTARR